MLPRTPLWDWNTRFIHCWECWWPTALWLISLQESASARKSSLAQNQPPPQRWPAFNGWWEHKIWLLASKHKTLKGHPRWRAFCKTVRSQCCNCIIAHVLNLLNISSIIFPIYSPEQSPAHKSQRLRVCFLGNLSYGTSFPWLIWCFNESSITSHFLQEKISQWIEVARKKELNDLGT